MLFLANFLHCLFFIQRFGIFVKLLFDFLEILHYYLINIFVHNMKNFSVGTDQVLMLKIFLFIFRRLNVNF